MHKVRWGNRQTEGTLGSLTQELSWVVTLTQMKSGQTRQTDRGGAGSRPNPERVQGAPEN